MSEELRARLYRLLAATHENRAAHYRFVASAIDTAAAVRRLAAAMQAVDDREVATHPDLAELNVMLDGFYAAEEPQR